MATSRCKFKCGVPKALSQSWVGHSGGVCAVSWEPMTQLRFVSGGMDAKIKLWDATQDKKLVDVVDKRDGHTMAIRDVAFNRNGTEVVSASDDKFSIIFDTAKMHPKLKLKHTKSVRLAKYPQAEQHQLAVLTLSQGISQWDLRSGELAVDYKTSCMPTTMCFLDDERFVAAFEDRTLAVYNWENPNAIQTINNADGAVLTGQVVHLERAPNGKFLAAQHDCSRITVFSLEENGLQLQAGKQFSGHKIDPGGITLLSFSPDMSYITSGDNSGLAYVWDWKTMKLAAKLAVSKNKKACNGAIWHPNDRSCVLMFGKNDQIELWK